ncbi:thioredoxin domain-containing protein [Patescibacteria group bacterium]|jgi:protein-disulfide isomerase|nr:thioredoxin domain-containing protein [Patescibacteria group bacterium]
MHHSLLIALSILVAGLGIAGAIFLTQSAPEGSLAAGVENARQVADDRQPPEPQQPEGDPTLVTPPSEEDHVYGEPDAPITLIEFSDLECVFCARVHPTLKAVVDESGGEVNWVYRHFPLGQIHPQALPGAYAAECLAEYGGTEAFWDYIDAILLNEEPLGEETYRTYARAAGASEEDVLACIEDERYEPLVAEHMQNAVAAGFSGTPFIIARNQAGEVRTIRGAVPREQIEAAIDELR